MSGDLLDVTPAPESDPRPALRGEPGPWDPPSGTELVLPDWLPTAIRYEIERGELRKAPCFCGRCDYVFNYVQLFACHLTPTGCDPERAIELGRALLRAQRQPSLDEFGGGPS